MARRMRARRFHSAPPACSRSWCASASAGSTAPRSRRCRMAACRVRAAKGTRCRIGTPPGDRCGGPAFLSSRHPRWTYRYRLVHHGNQVSSEDRGGHMKTRAAVLRGLGQDWEVTELDLDGPKAGEVLIRYVASGLCHSDEHLRHGDIVPRYPIVGGHEGAGVIEDVGPGVTRLKAGDH